MVDSRRAGDHRTGTISSFAREPQPRDGEDVAGIGLRVVDRAVRFAGELLDAFGAIGELSAPLAVFAVRDRITGSDGPVRTIIVGATQTGVGNWVLLRDWELIKLLNPLADKPRSQVLAAETRTERGVTNLLEAAQHLSNRYSVSWISRSSFRRSNVSRAWYQGHRAPIAR